MIALVDDLVMAADPVTFARTCGIEPDLWQTAVLSSHQRQQILVCSRQAGKSTISAVLAVHTALYRPGSLILLLSPSLRQSQELFRKAVDVYEQGGQVVPSDVATRLTLELANGSRIVSLPGKEGTIRGFSNVALLLIDEASRVPDELYAAVRPMLAVSKGRLLLFSTPNGKRGFFWREWNEGGSDWHRTLVRAEDCPRIDPDWLTAERRRIPSTEFRQEYGCEFLTPDGALFDPEAIAALRSPVPHALFPNGVRP
jgi:hypothetical protein